ncbi:thermosome subunit, partial [Candidatus Pacearchaeota archaeon]|nr:thermosome subunit [Candidatus Pacearchaeota archaeon]
ILMDLALRITKNDEELLKQIAITAMTGKGAEDAKDRLAEIIVRVIQQIEDNGKIDLDDVKIEKAKGEGIKDTELISGIVLDKEKISYDMPSSVFNAKIALVDFPLEIRNPEIETKISITSPEQLHSFVIEEEREIKELVEKIKLSGANVVFCQKGVDDFARYLLTKEKIYVCRRVARSDMEKISKATNGKIISNINELTAFEIGNAKKVEEIKRGYEIFTYITGCQNPKVLTILIHGGTEHVIDEVKRAIKDGLGDVACVVQSGLVVPGGGAIESELAKQLREFAQGLSGREQLAVEEFASALEFIPVTLAENAGIDPIDVLTELKSRHDAGEKHAGLNLYKNVIENVLEAKIIEPLKIKTQAINSATDVAIMILRIDDIISATGKTSSSKFDPRTLGKLSPEYPDF